MAVHNSLDKAILEATDLLHLAPNRITINLRSLSNILVKVYKIDGLFVVSLHLNYVFAFSKDYKNLKCAMKYVKRLFEDVGKENCLSLDEITVFTK